MHEAMGGGFDSILAVLDAALGDTGCLVRPAPPPPLRPLRWCGSIGSAALHKL
jgi:hypothetical protein